MKRFERFAFVALLAASMVIAALGAAAPDGGGSSSPPPARPLPDHFRPLIARSLFSKDRNRPAGERSPDTRPASDVPHDAEVNYVLRGVALEDQAPIAFFEQKADQMLVRVRAGEAVSKGTLERISLDGVDYRAGAQMRHVPIGYSLDGSAQAAPTPSSTQPTTKSAGAPDDSLSGEKPSWWVKKKK